MGIGSLEQAGDPKNKQQQFHLNIRLRKKKKHSSYTKYPKNSHVLLNMVKEQTYYSWIKRAKNTLPTQSVHCQVYYHVH